MMGTSNPAMEHVEAFIENEIRSFPEDYKPSENLGRKLASWTWGGGKKKGLQQVQQDLYDELQKISKNIRKQQERYDKLYNLVEKRSNVYFKPLSSINTLIDADLELIGNHINDLKRGAQNTRNDLKAVQMLYFDLFFEDPRLRLDTREDED